MKKSLPIYFLFFAFLGYSQNFSDEMHLFAEGTQLQSVEEATTNFYKESKIQVISERKIDNIVIDAFTENQERAAVEGDVVINEFMASNDFTVADQDGEFDDWIELFNTTNADIDLTGFFLSDNPENLDKYDIPDGTIIPANGYLIIWADEDGMQQGFHANFRISADGEELFLLNSDTIIIDEITFGPQQTDISFARIPNGMGDFAFRTPTFAANNDDSTTSLEEVVFGSNALTIYPNPATNNFTLTLTDKTIQELTIEIFDVYGRLVFQQKANIPQQQINTAALAEGLYFVVVNQAVGEKLTIVK